MVTATYIYYLEFSPISLRPRTRPLHLYGRMGGKVLAATNFWPRPAKFLKNLLVK